MLHIDPIAGTIAIDDCDEPVSLGSPEGFRIISRLWLRSGWDTKYVYGFSWLGRPIIQLPEDLVRVQEVIYRVKPLQIIETGVAHGGGLVFYAGLLRAMGIPGKVIGVDIEIRPPNRAAIEAHELSDFIHLVEGDSLAPETIEQVRGLVDGDGPTLVVLDSSHSSDHVRAELECYGDLVSPGSYAVVADAIMASLAGAPRSRTDWTWNNPATAIAGFLEDHAEFEPEDMEFPFNEGLVTERVTYWPGGFLRRRSA